MGPEETGMEIDLSLKLDAQKEETATEDQDHHHHQEEGEFPAEGKREAKADQEAIDEEDTSVDNNSLSETMKTDKVYPMFF